ncbi:MAG: flagellar hook protein FlgE [Pseudomonadota bacterium]
MSILRSMYTGVAGLRSNGSMLSTIGDNIANVNTIGFKGSRVNFSDVLGQSIIGIAGAMDKIGLGSSVAEVQQILTQGAIQRTGYETDMAISGNGFFVLEGTHDGRQGVYYSRAGQFVIDADGFVVNPEGLLLQGYPVDAAGNASGVPGDINLSSSMAPPNASTRVDIAANFDAGATIDPGGAAFDPADPAATSNFSTTITVYDSLGQSHEVDVYFRHTAAGWEYHGLVDGGELTGGAAGTASEVVAGTLTFDANGALDTEAQTVNTFNPIGATNPQPLQLDFGDAITTDGGTGVSGSTGYGADSSVVWQTQDGYGTGSLQYVSISPDGAIVGSFSNGQVVTLARVALSLFSGATELERVGGNLFQQTTGSGEPVVGMAGEAGRGAIVGGALEASNVDLAEEFVNMIAAQRGFQANSKTITTADQLLAELISLKR